MRKEFYEKAVAIEHRRLDGLFLEALRALRENDPPDAARSAFTRLRNTLEEHFRQEDKVYYPAVGRLSPAHEPVLQELMLAHREFRTRMSDVRALFVAADLAGAERSLAALAGEFTEHESVEERLLASIQEEMAAAGDRS